MPKGGNRGQGWRSEGTRSHNDQEKGRAGHQASGSGPALGPGMPSSTSRDLDPNSPHRPPAADSTPRPAEAEPHLCAAQSGVAGSRPWVASSGWAASPWAAHGPGGSREADVLGLRGSCGRSSTLPTGQGEPGPRSTSWFPLLALFTSASQERCCAQLLIKIPTRTRGRCQCPPLTDEAMWHREAP